VKTDPKKRALENADLIRRMLAGESLALVPSQATWWQPRPTIKKDRAALDLLHGEAPERSRAKLGFAPEEQE
jgi:hypothetical protein